MRIGHRLGMTLYRVPILKPGTYRLSPSPGYPQGRRVTYTAQTSRQLASQGKAMLKAGLSVPLCWEHHRDAEPAYLSNASPQAWKARGYAGPTRDFAVDPDGTCVALCEIFDPEEARQFAKVARVSPCLLQDWQDERSKTWPGLSVLHIGITTNPVQRTIPPATPAAYLSHSPTSKPQPKHDKRVWLSFPTSIQRSADMADEIEDVTEGDVGQGDNAKVGKIVKLLERKGLHLGSPKSWDELHIALEAAVNTSEGGANEEMGESEYGGDEGEGEDTPEDTDPIASSPMMMSILADVMPSRVLAIQQDINELQTSGRIDIKLRNALTKELASVNLSHEPHKKFNAKTGKLKNFKLLDKIACYKDLPPGKFAKANLSFENTDAVTHSVNTEVKQAGDAMLERLNKIRTDNGQAAYTALPAEYAQ